MKEIDVARSKQVAARLLDGEMIIMSASDSTLFNLNAVATLIWQAVDSRTPLSEIVADRICTEFDVSLDVAWRDAEEFVRGLALHGILTVADARVTCLGSCEREKP
jgi:hypothetical protein